MTSGSEYANMVITGKEFECISRRDREAIRSWKRLSTFMVWCYVHPSIVRGLDSHVLRSALGDVLQPTVYVYCHKWQGRRISSVCSTDGILSVILLPNPLLNVDILASPTRFTQTAAHAFQVGESSAVSVCVPSSYSHTCLDSSYGRQRVAQLS